MNPTPASFETLGKPTGRNSSTVRIVYELSDNSWLGQWFSASGGSMDKALG